MPTMTEARYDGLADWYDTYNIHGCRWHRCPVLPRHVCQRLPPPSRYGLARFAVDQVQHQVHQLGRRWRERALAAAPGPGPDRHRGDRRRRPAADRPAGFLAGAFDLNWRLALGGQPLTPAEQEALAAALTGSVEVEGEGERVEIAATGGSRRWGSAATRMRPAAPGCMSSS